MILGICVFSLSSSAQVEEDEQRVENEQEALMQTYSETSFFYSLIDEDVSHERIILVVVYGFVKVRIVILALSFLTLQSL